MNQACFFLAADDRNRDSRGLGYRFQYAVAIRCFSQRTGSNSFNMRRTVLLQLFLKIDKSLYGSIDRVRGDSAFRKHVLSEAYRLTDTVNHLVSAVGICVSNR